MKKDKVSLFRDLKLDAIFKSNFKEGIKLYMEKSSKEPTDERILIENNKIYYCIYSLLIIILFLVSIFSDKFNIVLNAYKILIIIGIVSYMGLILMCKKDIIESNSSAFVFFIWSIGVTPVTLFNILPFSIINLFIAIILIIVLYNIANLVYKNAAKKLK